MLSDCRVFCPYAVAASRANSVQPFDGVLLIWEYQLLGLRLGFLLRAEGFPIKLRVRPTDVIVNHRCLLNVLLT
jgi:hypothetical protein